jgi:2'-5' RNA ligase
LRLFLAVELGALRDSLDALARSWCGDSRDWRRVASASMHLTLRFLGEVQGAREIELREQWREAARGVGPFELALGAPGQFPPRGPARVLWCGVREEPRGRLSLLAERIEVAAVAAGFEPGKRRFRPHVTLARVRGRPARRDVPDWRGSGMGAVPVEAVVLFRSKLGPGGARYTALERFPLQGGPGEAS